MAALLSLAEPGGLDALANDPLNLLAVAAAENRAKGDGDASRPVMRARSGPERRRSGWRDERCRTRIEGGRARPIPHAYVRPRSHAARPSR